MPWMQPTKSMNEVLEQMNKIPLAEKLGFINGVKIKTLKKFSDPRGYFIEQLKAEDKDDQGNLFIEEQPFAQMSRSLTYARGGNPPELIKAFHWHKQQWDYWDFIVGNVRVVLVDLREGSPTAGKIQVICMGANDCKIVAIPPLVAHGYQVVSHEDVVLNYYVTNPYNPTNPDEGRIAFNDPRIAFDWHIENI